MKNHAKKLPVFLTACLLFCAALLVPFGGGEVSADVNAAPASIDETNVLDDLEGSTLNGRKFDKDDFAQSDVRDPQIISLVEYGYNFYASRQNDYALYVYIYNPRVIAFDDDPARNQIQMSVGETPENTYALQFLNYSTETGYEGLFYKYRVGLTDTQKREVLNGLTRAERVYKVTEFELVTKGEVTAYPCATTYTFKGFAKGYTSELAADESTLTCSVDGFEEYVELDVHQTVYRPHGLFYGDEPQEGDDESTPTGQLYNGNQPQINSCYFRVPEKYFLQYGELTKALCKWFEYTTQPIFVTNDRTAYNALHALYGAPLTSYDSTHKKGALVMSWGNEYYSSPANWHKTPFLWSSNIDINLDGNPDDDYYVYYGEHAYGLYWPGGDITGEEWLNQRFDNLAAVLFSNAQYYSANVDGDKLKSELLLNSRQLGGNMYAGQYSEALFSDNVDPGRTRGENKELIELKKNDKVIWNEAVEDEHFWGIGNELVKDEQGIQVQKGLTIDKDDLEGEDFDIAQRLYIDENDIADLKNEFAKAQSNNEKVVLLRYAVTNYHSGKAIAKIMTMTEEDEADKDEEIMHAWMDEYHYDRINGYLAQETVFLDFNVISLWFATDGAETEIPVMMTPMDVISSVQPGVAPEPDTIGSDSLPWWVWLVLVLIIIVVIIVLSIFFPVLRPIFSAIGKAIWIVISAPFRLIAFVIKKISEAVKKRKAEKAAAPPPPKPPQKPDAPPPKKTVKKTAATSAKKTARTVAAASAKKTAKTVAGGQKKTTAPKARKVTHDKK